MSYQLITMPGARLYMENGELVESMGAMTGPSMGPVGRKHVHQYSCECPPAMDGTCNCPSATDGVVEALSSPAVHIAGSAAATYHGWKRTQSLGWTLVWGAVGGIFPIFTGVLAVAQGYGKRKRR